MTTLIRDQMLIDSGVAQHCPHCNCVYSLDAFQVNGVGRRMGICQGCYEVLFKMGPVCPRKPELDARLPQIQAAAHEGLRRLRQPRPDNGKKYRYGYAVRRR